MTLDLTLPATEVAPQLVGAVIHGRGVSVRLTEVEAYLGDADPGSHAYRGQTRRNATMFGPPGHLYVYFTYGMHVCANVACSPEGVATGVLLRAGEVVSGIELARERRVSSKRDTDLASGPARLCVALGIELSDDGADLKAGAIRLEPTQHPVALSDVATGPRVGVSGAGGSDAFPWRYWIAGGPTVSAYKPAVPRVRSSRTR
ncbi:MAG TPA: DNA-3-methyladenine glycosylase [Pseudolysinimonas sp.]|nr:DNA-3-methyladenine glycosylase [Pseudolysinimonas sp.]